MAPSCSFTIFVPELTVIELSSSLFTYSSVKRIFFLYNFFECIFKFKLVIYNWGKHIVSWLPNWYLSLYSFYLRDSKVYWVWTINLEKAFTGHTSIHRVIILNRGSMFAFQWREFSPPLSSAHRLLPENKERLETLQFPKNAEYILLPQPQPPQH